MPGAVASLLQEHPEFQDTEKIQSIHPQEDEEFKRLARMTMKVLAANGVWIVLNDGSAVGSCGVQEGAPAGAPLKLPGGKSFGKVQAFRDENHQWAQYELELLQEFATTIVHHVEYQLQQKRLELANTRLAEERDLLRTLIDSSPDYIFAKDKRGRFIISNKAHDRAAHIEDATALIGKVASQVFPPELAAQYDEDDRRVLQQGKPLLNLERQTIDADGNLRWVLTSKVPFTNRQGAILGLVGISRDITARRLAEEKVRENERFIAQILATSPGFVYVYDLRKQRNIYSNMEIANILGYTPAAIEDIGTALFPTLMHPDDLNQLPDHLHAVLQLADGEIKALEYRMRHQDGRYRWLFGRETIFRRDEAGNPVQVIGVVIDISHRKEAEAALQKVYEQVRALEQLKTDMIRLAAHDLRNPLTAASGYLEMIWSSLAGSTTPQIEHYFLMANSALKSMQKIIRDILSLQRIESLSRNEHHDEFDFLHLMEEVISTLQHPVERADLEMTFTSANAPLKVHGDLAQLREALHNLIGNAIKYTPPGGTIQIRLGADETHLWLEIEDSGYGIPKVMQTRIFQPFFRAKTVQTEHIEGSGLGLHLVKNIIERHQGNITFQSQAGVGSTFRLELPLA
jgi:PAS domain S-box-containing protein